MLTAGDALAKSQKVTFWSKKKWLLMLFFLLTAKDALILFMVGRLCRVRTLRFIFGL